MQVLYTAEVVGNQCKGLWFSQFSLVSSWDTLWAENTHTPAVGCYGDGMTHRRCLFAMVTEPPLALTLHLFQLLCNSKREVIQPMDSPTCYEPVYYIMLLFYCKFCTLLRGILHQLPPLPHSLLGSVFASSIHLGTAGIGHSY